MDGIPYLIYIAKDEINKNNHREGDIGGKTVHHNSLPAVPSIRSKRKLAEVPISERHDEFAFLASIFTSIQRMFSRPPHTASKHSPEVFV